MEKIFRFACFILCIIMLASCFCGQYAFSFFSSAAEKNHEASTGSVKVGIEGLQVKSESVYKTENGITTKAKNERKRVMKYEEITESSASSKILQTNKSNTFSFTVTNLGRSIIEYELDIKMAWDSELGEKGRLFLYPSSISDKVICDNLKNGVYDNALNYGASDNTPIKLSTGLQKGISITLDNNVLAADVSQGAVSRDYSFKLFLFADAEIAANPLAYQNKDIEIIISVQADILGRTSNWATENTEFFRVTSSIDSAPVISEIKQSKTFFINKSSSINLASYASAYDEKDGDITQRIQITSIPEYVPNKAGTYTITYNVVNEAGLSAVPLEITIVVWEFVKITSGYYHTLALTSHGSVYTWGYNYYGQLGDGTMNTSTVPKLLKGFDSVIDIAAGTYSSYIVCADGQAYAWGYNRNGRLGDGTDKQRNNAVKVSQPPGVKFVKISARFDTAGALTAEGDLYTWGCGDYGATGSGATDDVLVPAKIALSNVADFELGYLIGAAVTKSGVLYTWGDNSYGQLGRGTSVAADASPGTLPYFANIKIKSISVGGFHMAAVTQDGRLFTWGSGTGGQLGNGQFSDKNAPQLISSLTAVNNAVAGFNHTGVLTEDGRAYFFGQNEYGKSGNGNTDSQSSPIELTTFSNISCISLAINSSFILVNSVVYGVGYGGLGVLGTGNNNNSNAFVKWALSI